MSKALEARVREPGLVLSPAHRMVLLTIAGKVKEGEVAADVDRTRLARYLHTSVDVVRGAIVAGETLGLCRRGKGQLVVFATDGLFEPEAPAEDKPAVRPRAETEPVAAKVPAHKAIEEFGRRRMAHGYPRSVPERRFYGMARDSGMLTLTLEELVARMEGFFDDPDPFCAQAAHAFSLFCKRINHYGTRHQPAPRESESARTREMLRRQREAG